MDSVEGFGSPDEAAVAGWPEAAGVHVVSVTVAGNRAEVVLNTEPEYRYWVYCVKRNGRWEEAVSGSGPTEGWDDPATVEWRE